METEEISKEMAILKNLNDKIEHLTTERNKTIQYLLKGLKVDYAAFEKLYIEITQNMLDDKRIEETLKEEFSLLPPDRI